MMKWDNKGMNKLIKSEVLYCILQKNECKGSDEISKVKNIKTLWD